MADAAPIVWKVGDVTITKVVELEIPGPATWIVPDATPANLARETWLQPHFADAEGMARMSVHALVVESEATVGGGALPGETLPSVALRLDPRSAARLQASLRREDPCVVARVERGAVVVDLRTVAAAQDEALGGALRAALGVVRA